MVNSNAGCWTRSEETMMMAPCKIEDDLVKYHGTVNQTRVVIMCRNHWKMMTQ